MSRVHTHALAQCPPCLHVLMLRHSILLISGLVCPDCPAGAHGVGGGLVLVQSSPYQRACSHFSSAHPCRETC